jgi:hypothetical protein
VNELGTAHHIDLLQTWFFFFVNDLALLEQHYLTVYGVRCAFRLLKIFLWAINNIFMSVPCLAFSAAYFTIN